MKKALIHEMRDDIMQSDVMNEIARRTFFANIDPRRRQEVAEGGMLSEDPHAFANCPQRAIHAEYPTRDGNYQIPNIRNFMSGRRAIDDDYEMR